MKLGDYTYLYNAAAYFAARERYGATERARLEEYQAATDETAKKSAEYLEEVERLQAEADGKAFAALISTQTQEGFETLCWGVATLAAEGERWRRYMQNDPRELLTPERVRAELQPWQIAEAKALVMQAMIRGLKPPQDDKAEVDEVLEALQKKTASR